MTITFQALPLVEKAEQVQVRFTLHLRDQLSMWMQDGCKSLYAFLHGIKWTTFHSHLDYFQKPPLEGRPNTKPGDHGPLNTHNYWFIPFYHVWGPAWIEFIEISIWLRAWSYMTSHYTEGSVTTLHDFEGVLGRRLDAFLWALTIPWSRLLALSLTSPGTGHVILPWFMELRASPLKVSQMCTLSFTGASLKFNLREMGITPVTIFSDTCVIVPLTLSWGLSQVTLKVNTFIINVTSQNTWRVSVQLIYWAWVCSVVWWSVRLCYTIIYKLTKNAHKWHLYNSELKYFFRLHFKGSLTFSLT